MKTRAAQGYALGAFVLARMAHGVEVDDVVHAFTVFLNLVSIIVSSFSLLFYKMSVVRPDLKVSFIVRNHVP